MSVIELQNNLVRLAVETEEQNILKQVLAYFKALKKENGYCLTPEQEAELRIAIEETYHEENLVDHEVVMKRYERWLIE
jgi:hypothetical protein